MPSSIDALVEASWYSSKIEPGLIPSDKGQASNFLAAQAISYPSLAYQFVNAFRATAVVEAGLVTSINTNFYSPDVDDNVFVELTKYGRANAGYNVPKEVNSQEVARYFSQLSNMYAKFVSILGGRELGDQHDPRLYELPDNGRDFWRSDWDRFPEDVLSLSIADSVVKLENLKKLMESWAFPAALGSSITELFAVKRISGDANSPYVGFVPSRVPGLSVQGDRDSLPIGLSSSEVLGLGPAGYRWMDRGDSRDQDARFFVPPSARSLELELTAFRSNMINVLIHAMLIRERGLAMPMMSLPESVSMTPSTHWLSLWENGGVTHESFVVPNAGAHEFDLRVRVPFWAPGSVDQGIIPWFTHGYGESWSGIAGRCLVNNYIGQRSGGISVAGRLPTVVYYDPDPRKGSIRNQIKGVLDLSLSQDALGMRPMDRFHLGWRNVVHFPDSIARGISEVGVLPATAQMGKLYFADTAKMRADAWFSWLGLFGMPN